MLRLRLVSALIPGLFICLHAAHFSRAAEVPSGPAAPQVAPASDEGELAIKRLQIPPGFKVQLVAAEPLLANPIAFSIDSQGRFYVCETFRLHDGVTDIRGKDRWLDEDLAARTVDDRLALMKRHLGERIAQTAIQSDRVRRIEDRDGDGVGDHATVFADGFNHPLDGLGAGVITRGNQVWYANIPNLWLLRDENGDGVADARKSLHYGYGVRIGFIGHDLHGLCFGPDGKLYFSIGDRGAHVRTSNGSIVGDPDSGAVFRCNPDGSDLELFAYGLRNPQELAFDQYGNLFTGDNNSDGGDRARFVYVVEGGDSGWRIGYQFIQQPNPRGPWNSEKLWHPAWDGQAAYIVPPIANLGDGPSGLAYYPGIGLPDRFQEHFFMCDFHGGRGSGIHSFALKPSGASFELVDRQNFLWEGLPTDVEFGNGGGVYFSDWVQGWGKTGKGRIYHVFDPEILLRPQVVETKKLLSTGMERRSNKELADLLGHADLRVRQSAQFALAERRATAVTPLIQVAQNSDARLARLHAIWALGQILTDREARLGRTEHRNVAGALVALLEAPDAEVRAQAAKVIGDSRLAEGAEPLLKLLKDSEPRVRFFAAMSIGKFGQSQSISAILTMLRENNDRDPLLRHAGVMALTRIQDFDALLQAAKDESAAVRMGALLALRRLQRNEVAQFLHDASPAIVAESARAINDQPVYGALQELAALIDRPGLAEPVARRVINAQFRIGRADSASALARFAARSDAAPAWRAEALLCLADWENPSGRDRVTGCWRPIVGPRDATHARTALESVFANILENAPAEVRLAAIEAAENLRWRNGEATLFETAFGAGIEPAVRVAALNALAKLGSPRLAQAVHKAANDPNELLRKEAARLLSVLDPAEAVAELARVLETGSIAERQNALTALGNVNSPEADRLLTSQLDQLLQGTLPPAVHLELLEAAGKKDSPDVKQRVAEYMSRLNSGDPLSSYRMALHGGDFEEGKRIFIERAEAACFRCHKINGEGGEVGPDLTGIGAQKSREYILQAILRPNDQVAEGYENVIVTLKNGGLYAGIIQSETDSELILNSPEDGIVPVNKSEIVRRDRGISSMPEGIENVLSKKDLRDLVEFLAASPSADGQ